MNYPNVSDRVKAIITDSAVQLVFIILVSYCFSAFQKVPNEVKAITFGLIFLIYDPFFTSFFGGTLGHKMHSLKVKKASNQSQNISFFMAIIRFVFKTILGIISLLTISSNDERKAIHDKLSGSIVLHMLPTNS